ncbi:phosphotriesterase-related protein [Microbacterium sp. AG1240]|uniref:phosphotriesterase family protein n=1 Tax=Microbacterium sp. AG1240 TaxID=2183992 RepID=UPI000EACE641|nr:phosphotriesterase [Microbacterium sp. AG1240]RKT35831.1 phosphotriesterase-related protein [Microbacterium sp. AG1240]
MIETVTGRMDAALLGATCMHDHVLSDASRLRRDGAAPAPAGEAVSIDTLGYLRWNALALADNLVLDDPALAAGELGRAVGAGQRAVVECSSWGLGPRHAGLPAVSAASGMTIVSSYGAYVPRIVPGWIAEMSERELERHFVEALTVGIPGAGFRAGMLGIMGTTGELEHREREQLRAAARAAVRTGASVSVRLDPDAFRGPEVLRLMGAEGLAADRVVFANVDEYLDAAYWAALSDAGAVLEMCFGTEAVHVGRVDNPSDRERLAFFPEFVAAHPEARVVLGESVWTKAQLRAYGGFGYAYLVERIVPDLRRRGVPDGRLHAMLVSEPRRLLDRPDASQTHA